MVPVIQTLLLTVLALSVERWLALRTAFGTGSLTKFVANIKAALNDKDFNRAQQLCDKQKGSVANVVSASLHAYKAMETVHGIKLSQKIAKIQQAHEEATGGGGDSLALSAGISEALINTAFGITTSWFAVISYGFFTNKIDKLTYALDEVGYSIAQTYEANHADDA